MARLNPSLSNNDYDPLDVFGDDGQDLTPKFEDIDLDGQLADLDTEDLPLPELLDTYDAFIPDVDDIQAPPLSDQDDVLITPEQPELDLDVEIAPVEMAETLEQDILTEDLNPDFNYEVEIDETPVMNAAASEDTTPRLAELEAKLERTVEEKLSSIDQEIEARNRDNNVASLSRNNLTAEFYGVPTARPMLRHGPGVA